MLELIFMKNGIMEIKYSCSKVLRNIAAFAGVISHKK